MYRSGHNGAHSKCVREKSPVGSNPTICAKKEVTFVYQKLLLFLSKPQAWHIIAARSAVHIISPFGAVSHHALACILLRLDDIQHLVLMIHRNRLRMIYKARALIYLRKCDIIYPKAKGECYGSISN